MKNLRILFALAICWAICSAVDNRESSDKNPNSPPKEENGGGSGEGVKPPAADDGSGGSGSGSGSGDGCETSLISPLRSAVASCVLSSDDEEHVTVSERALEDRKMKALLEAVEEDQDPDREQEVLMEDRDLEGVEEDQDPDQDQDQEVL
ncbi:unnamed protein product, partial [Hymenolepis diminuta]